MMRAVPCALLATALLLACDNTPVCVPEAKTECVCAEGRPGEQVCESNGLGYAECECLVASGADAGGGDDGAGETTTADEDTGSDTGEADASSDASDGSD